MMPLPTLQHPPAHWNAVAGEPDSDLPRLRYADWLDERCDPLGELIRVQCRLAGGPRTPRVAVELERREHELLAEYEQEWTAPLAGLVDWCVLRRGFVAEAAVSAAAFLAHADAIFEQACLSELHVRDADECLPELLQSPWLARLRHLDLSNNRLRDAGAQLVAACPHLGGLASLNLSSAAIGNAGAAALAQAPGLGGLRELYLCDNRIGASGVRALADSLWARRLRVLHLRFNDLGADGGRLLRQTLGECAQI